MSSITTKHQNSLWVGVFGEPTQMLEFNGCVDSYSCGNQINVPALLRATVLPCFLLPLWNHSSLATHTAHGIQIIAKNRSPFIGTAAVVLIILSLLNFHQLKSYLGLFYESILHILPCIRTVQRTQLEMGQKYQAWLMRSDGNRFCSFIYFIYKRTPRRVVLIVIYS